MGLDDEWRNDCPAHEVPAWVFDAGRWYRLYERKQTPMHFGRAEWLPFAYLEVMQEFEAAEGEERSKAKGRG